MSSNQPSAKIARYKRRLCLWLAIAIGSFGLVQLSAALLKAPAQAQEAIAEEDILNYASTVSAIEPLRIEAYEAASDTLAAANSEISLVDNELSCLSSSLEDMPEADTDTQAELQRILVAYCNAASEAAEANGLTPERFNAITAEHRADRELAQRIREAAASSDDEAVTIEPAEE